VAGAPQEARSVNGALLSFEEARDRIQAALPDALPAQRVSPVDGLGCVLAEAVTATTDLPPWDNSAMDGYAVRSVDVAAATEDRPVRLRVVGEAPAGGATTGTIEAGTAIRIATGAILPPGADAVVQVESTTPFDTSGSPTGPRGRDAGGPLPAACAIHVAVRAGTAIRRRAEDVERGAIVLEPGTVVTPTVVSLAAGVGAASIAVHGRPRVAVLATGDEVRGPGSPLGPFGLPDANGPGLRAMAIAAGADVIDLGIATDDLDEVLERLGRGIAEADAVIVSGGVSVGPYDVVRAAFERLGRIDLWRVAVQPGKPFAFGLAQRPGRAGPEGPVLLFGLPGNPASSFVTFELFVRPALRHLAGHRAVLRSPDRGVLLEAVTKAAGRRAFLRASAVRDAEGVPARDAAGRVSVGLAGGQGSHMLRAVAAADLLAIVPETVDALPAGAEVRVWWLDRP
jgi:molybdopterin molybdotransferase